MRRLYERPAFHVPVLVHVLVRLAVQIVVEHALQLVVNDLRYLCNLLVVFHVDIGPRGLHLLLPHRLPVNTFEEWVVLYLFRALGPRAQPLAWVPVKEAYDQRLALLGETRGDLEDALLNIVE